jgi:hypothetical protein
MKTKNSASGPSYEIKLSEKGIAKKVVSKLGPPANQEILRFHPINLFIFVIILFRNIWVLQM